MTTVSVSCSRQALRPGDAVVVPPLSWMANHSSMSWCIQVNHVAELAPRISVNKNLISRILVRMSKDLLPSMPTVADREGSRLAEE